MMTVLSIIVFLIVLTVIVTIHELGHFYFARKADILCHEFAIGMGPVIYQKRKGEIVYSVRAIPLGGYVAMAGEEMKDAYIKKNQNIGIRLDEDNLITHIVLNDDVEYDVLGKVIDYDLYGKDMSKLFISLELADGSIVKYEVKRNAKYLFKNEKPMWITPEERSFESKTLWQRFKVIFAGPAANLILAFILLFILAFFIGKPNNDPVIGSVSEGLGINSGDVVSNVNGIEVNSFSEISKIIHDSQNNKVVFTVDGNDVELNLVIYMQGLGLTSKYGEDSLIVGQVFGRTKKLEAEDLITGILISENEVSGINYVDVSNWNELIKYVNDNDGQYVYIRYEREGNILEDSYSGISHNALNKLDARPVEYSGGFSQDRKFNILYPLYYPFVQMTDDISGMINTVGLLINPNEQVGIRDLAGPVGIFSLVSSSLSQGFLSLLSFIAFLSINIAVLNLLPIPALDGGRLVFLGFEAITRKKVNKNVENILINITFILLLVLIIFVTYNDILRLFS